MTAPKLEEVQSKVIDILLNFHHFCEENKIDYYIIGGTLIGAVRHNGIIPWDDDIDVGIPRESYDRLLKIKDEIPYPLYLSSFDNDDEYIYSFAKCYDSTTVVTEKLKKPFTRGLWIDVFPLDGTFNNKLLQRMHYISVRFLKTLFATKMGAYKPEREHGMSRVQRNIMLLLASFFSAESIQAMLQKLLKIKHYSTSNYVGNLLGRWGKREIVPKDFFNKKVLFDFSGHHVYGPSDYDGYLRSIYGDYMKLPPLDKRVVEHAMENISLNTSR